MTKRLLVFLLLSFFYIVINAQENGIIWNDNLSWEQLRYKAKEENRFIFIDCYATWCGPCKKMDRDVYSDQKVGEYMNKKFLSVKLQIDSTGSDNETVKRRYKDARLISQQYNITSLPTFLFFSPDGKLINKEFGFRKLEDFISLANLSIDLSSQFDNLLNDYYKGKLELSNFPILARMARTIKNDSLVNKIIIDYKKHYLDHLPDQLLFNKQNLNFVAEFSEAFLIDGSRGRIFNFFYNFPDSAGKLLGRSDFVKYYVKRIITIEEIENNLWLKSKPISKPQWNKYKASIAGKYDEFYANQLVLESKLFFYWRIKAWRKFANVWDRKIKKNPPKANRPIFDLNGTWMLNVYAWEVFLNCRDKHVLRRALNWINIAIKLKTDETVIQYLDTRANLLYKLGRVNDAIIQEEKAIELGISMAKKDGKVKGYYFDKYNEILNKMKKGEPTWVTDVE